MDLALLTGQRPADVIKLKRTDIRDGALWIVQNKTGARLGIEVTGELAAVIARISERPRRAISAYLIQDEDGQPLSSFALRSRFDKARTQAGVNFQFRDIRAKAATDTGDLAHSQSLLGHKNREMTEHYVKTWVGASVMPLANHLQTRGLPSNKGDLVTTGSLVESQRPRAGNRTELSLPGLGEVGSVVV